MSDAQKIAIYPGTFDPMTLGHLDVLKTSAAIFDEVVVALLVNPEKKPLFCEEERLAMIEESIREVCIVNVRTISFDGLTVELARREKAIAIIRGLRLITDYEAEFGISFNNHVLDSGIYTVFIPPLQEHVHVSSSMIRELLSFGRTDLSKYVPQAALKYISAYEYKDLRNR
ncbi:MAG: pantetheine-phosphate adenylyltransferase [Candidatus Colwellbacteria bacterium]|nr:pantetheine-phosphate adenylyltransferase [Candidatus Colwellbacteria bacterium]